MSREKELWASAMHVLERQGDVAPLYIAQKIGELAQAGDEEAVAAWGEIARCVDDLMHNPGSIQ